MPSRLGVFSCLLVQAICSISKADESVVRAIVVRPSAWAPAIEDWKRHRAAQGYEIVELDSAIGKPAIKTAIAAEHAAHSESTKFVLLCGDIGPVGENGIATFYRESTALVQVGGDKLLATDTPYVDLDDDELPDLAIGRIPADSPQQLEAVMQRIIRYESQVDHSQWRRNVHVVAGVGGFGVVADSVIEMTTRKFLGDRIPGWSRVTMTQASLSSHYCPNPTEFSTATLARVNEGGMFWVYIGHGHIETLDSMRVQRSYYPIMDVRSLPHVDTGTKPPIAIFLACYTGAMDSSRDSLAERLVLSETGPIAAIAASRVSGPYGLAMLSNGMLSGFYQRRMGTLGEIVMYAKRQAMEEVPAAVSSGDSSLQMIDAIAKSLSPKGYDLRAERQEHVWQVQLIGDPMLKLSHPQEMSLQVAQQASPGEILDVRGQTQHAGNAMVELAYRRTDKRRELDRLPVDWQTEEGKKAYTQRYESANDGVVAKVAIDVEPSQPFSVSLAIPSDLPRGRYSIRVIASSPVGWEVGYTEVAIRIPRSSK